MTLDYYPFGLKQKGYNNVVSSNGNGLAQAYRFGGKEQNQELGLEWYDFGARNYDASIGRWMNLDPLAELMRRHSPYTYAFDNPIFYLDPDGRMTFGSSTVGDLTSGFRPQTSGVTFSEFDADKVEGASSNLVGNSITSNPGSFISEGSGPKKVEEGDNSDGNTTNNNKNEGGGISLTGGGKLVMGADGTEVVGGNTQKTDYTAEIWNDRSEGMQVIGAIGKLSSALAIGMSYSNTVGLSDIVQTMNKETLTGLRSAGRFVGGASILFGYYSYKNNYIGGYEFGSDSFATGIGMFGGPIGWGVSASYFIFKATGGLEIMQTRALRIQHEIKEGMNLQQAKKKYNCFVAGTQISMGDGSIKSIETIKVGNSVKTYNLQTGLVQSKKVLKIDTPVHDNLVQIEFDNSIQNINTTDHPYMVKGKGWCSFDPLKTKENYGIEVGQLKENDICFLLKSTNEMSEVKIINIQMTDRMETTYNLSEVEGNHNFFANGILVHNKLND